jgi:hypothetical protein
MSRDKLSKTQIIETLLNDWRGFPNTSVAGRYEFFSQTVYANSVEKKHLINLTQDFNNPQLIRQVFGVFIHELTHWLDHTGTLWGQNNLISIFNSINARKNNEEEEFWRIPQLVSELGRIHFADYYNVDGPGAELLWDRQPWRYQYSCGFQFGSDGKLRQDRPILFTRFYNYEGVLINRVPFSTASLIETNAVAAEFQIDSAILSIMNEDERLVESSVIQESLVNTIYDSSYTVYSVAAHCLANFLGIDDITAAYKLASSLSSLCLNLPSQVFQKLKITNPHMQEVWSERIPYPTSLKDRGFAFFAIAQYGSKENHHDVPYWIESTLQSAGLPSISELEKLAFQELNDIKQRILKGDATSELENLLLVGEYNLKKRGILGNHNLTFNALALNDKSLKLPPILLGDDQFVHFGDKAIEKSDKELEDWIFYIWDIEKEIQEFCKACLV